MGKRALIIGASGLTGAFALQYLLKEKAYDSVTVLGRKRMDLQHPKLSQVVTDFERFAVPECDDVFCCLGTTMAKAGGEEAFRRVDFEIPMAVAQAARVAGAKQFLLVSSIGAAIDSRYYYLRVKAELEEALGGMGFEGLKIFRPSLLMGARAEIRFKEFVGQFAMALLGPLMFGRLKRYKGIQAKVVGWAMVRVAEKNEPGKMIYENESIGASGA